MNKIIPLCLLLGALVATGCKKDDDDDPSPSGGTPAPTYPITGPAAFSITANGTTTVYTDGVNDYQMILSDIIGSNVANYTCRFKHMPTGNTGAQISMDGQSYAGATPTDDEFNASFTTGTKPFASFGPSPVGIFMSSSVGTSNYHTFQVSQAGSTYTITDSQPYDDGSGITKVKVRATFSCKFLNTSTGATHTATGIFVGVFAKST